MFHVFQKIGILRGLDIFTMQFSDVDAGKCAAYLAEQPLGGYIAAVDDRTESVPTARALNPETLKAMVFPDRFEDAPSSGIDDFEVLKGDDAAMWRRIKQLRCNTPGLAVGSLADPERGVAVDDDSDDLGKEDARRIDAIYRADPEALARLRERGTPIEDEPSLAMRVAAMAMQAGVSLEEDAAAGTRLGRPPLSPSSLLLPEVKP